MLQRVAGGHERAIETGVFGGRPVIGCEEARDSSEVANQRVVSNDGDIVQHETVAEGARIQQCREEKDREGRETSPGPGGGTLPSRKTLLEP